MTSRQPHSVVYHTTCSSKQMAVEQKFQAILKKCTGEAPSKRLNSLILDSAVPCCGMAGDRGTCALSMLPLVVAADLLLHRN